MDNLLAARQSDCGFQSGFDDAIHMSGIRRVALLDFDVHHGNGTEACLGRLLPQTLSYGLKTPLCQGQLNFKSFSPWLDVDDKDNFFFARYSTDRHHC